MRAPEKTRTMEVKQGDEWVKATMCQLDAGDVFRMFNPDGSPVVDHEGKAEWTVKEQPSIRHQ